MTNLGDVKAIIENASKSILQMDQMNKKKSAIFMDDVHW
jgi:hypothetical protein